MQSLHFQSITEKVIGAAFEVYNSLGSGYLERVYQNALTLAANAHPCARLVGTSMCLT